MKAISENVDSLKISVTETGLHYLGAAQIAYKDGNFIINPSYEELEGALLDLTVAGKK